ALAKLEVWNNKTRDNERCEMYDNLADLYTITKATEQLKKAYVCDIIPSSERSLVSSVLLKSFHLATGVAVIPAMYEHQAGAAASSTFQLKV
ncbi:hypothetical protein C5167_043533, partial [Papaver somniferum]